MSPQVRSPPLTAATFTHPHSCYTQSRHPVSAHDRSHFRPAPPRPALPYSTTGHGSDVHAAFRRHVASGLHNCSVGQDNSFTIGQPQHDSRHTTHSLNPTRPGHEQPSFLPFFLSVFLSFLWFISRRQHNALRHGAKPQWAYLKYDTGIWREGLSKST